MTRLGLVIAIALACACKKPPPSGEGSAPPPERVADCSKGPGKVTDAIAQPLVPEIVGAMCLDPSAEVRAYGKEARRSLDEVCTDLFDGECEAYKALGLDRVVTLRYLDPPVKGAAINVNLSRFPSADAAYAFYTKRVVGDADPATSKLEPFEAGTAAVRGAGVAYVVRGPHVAELTYLDDAGTVSSLSAAAKNALSPLAVALAARLPGEATPPRAVTALPIEKRWPAGVVFTSSDLLGVRGLGGGAIGFYRDGTKRWRVAIALHDDAAAAKSAFDAVNAWRSDQGTWVFRQSGGKIVGVGDDEHARRSRHTPEEAKAVTLDEAQKLELLTRVLGPEGAKKK